MDEGRKEVPIEESAFPHFDLFDSEIYGESSYPLLLPSQPPDIRNWFSSYESQQASDSIEDAYFLDGNQLNECETQDPSEYSRKRKLNEPRFSPGRKHPDLSKDFSRSDSFGSSMEHFSKKTTANSVPPKKKRCLRQILGDEYLTNCKNSTIDKSILPENEKICPWSDTHEEPKSLISEGKTCQEELGPENKCWEMTSNYSAQKIENQAHHTVETLNEKNSEAGFISPKIRPNLHDSREKEIKSRGNFDKEGHDPGVVRRPLIDKANHVNKNKDCGFRGTLVNTSEVSLTAEPIEDLSAGKWQCPRKRKPYVSPPMKQLGLEKWIRRVS